MDKFVQAILISFLKRFVNGKLYKASIQEKTQVCWFGWVCTVSLINISRPSKCFCFRTRNLIMKIQHRWNAFISQCGDTSDIWLPPLPCTIVQFTIVHFKLLTGSYGKYPFLRSDLTTPSIRTLLPRVLPRVRIQRALVRRGRASLWQTIRKSPTLHFHFSFQYFHLDFKMGW